MEARPHRKGSRESSLLQKRIAKTVCRRVRGRKGGSSKGRGDDEGGVLMFICIVLLKPF